MRENMHLSNYCRWNDYKSVIKFLQQYHGDDIDLAYNNGIYFRYAIKNGNVSMLNTLLAYYTRTQLQGDNNSMEYKHALFTLKKIFEDAERAFDISPGIQEIIGKYIPYEAENSDDEGNEQNLSGFDDIDAVDSSDHSTFLRKHNSESDLIQHQQIVGSKLLLHSSSESLLSVLDSSGSDDIHETSNLAQGSELFADS